MSLCWQAGVAGQRARPASEITPETELASKLNEKFFSFARSSFPADRRLYRICQMAGACRLSTTLYRPLNLPKESPSLVLRCRRAVCRQRIFRSFRAGKRAGSWLSSMVGPAIRTSTMLRALLARTRSWTSVGPRTKHVYPNRCRAPEGSITCILRSAGPPSIWNAHIHRRIMAAVAYRATAYRQPGPSRRGGGGPLESEERRSDSCEATHDGAGVRASGAAPNAVPSTGLTPTSYRRG